MEHYFNLEYCATAIRRIMAKEGPINPLGIQKIKEQCEEDPQFKADLAKTLEMGECVLDTFITQGITQGQADIVAQKWRNANTR
jgi:hypothetical protein